MRRLGIAVGAMTYTLLSAASAFAQSDIPPEVGGDVVAPPGVGEGVASTGTDVAAWMLIAAGLFAVAIGLLLAARRRARRVRT
jgi:LPXTG-motif cell wall-anchored protein